LSPGGQAAAATTSALTRPTGAPGGAARVGEDLLDDHVVAVPGLGLDQLGRGLAPVTDTADDQPSGDRPFLIVLERGVLRFRDLSLGDPAALVNVADVDRPAWERQCA